MQRRAPKPPTAGASHLEWLRLVDVSGPFLSLPVLKEALPQGLEADDRDVRAELKAAHGEWNAHSDDRAYHTQWIRFVLSRALEYGPEVLVDGPAIPAKLRVRAALHGETLQPDVALLGIVDQGDRPARLVIQMHDPDTDLQRALENAHWKASPLTRMVELLRGSSVSGLSLGLVTNGEQWVLVSAPHKGTTTFVTWHASLWFEEKITLQSFRTLLGVRRTLGAVDDTLERLIERSAEHQHDVTIQLGLQVREAIELLVRRIDELDRRSNRTVLAGVSEKQVYEAAVTVMMRLVFVFYLEEQADLYFPVAKSTFYQRHYALSPLGATLRADADRLGPDVLERRSSAWCRLLACFRAIHGGVVHEDMRLPAYGGHLFDPDRFPFLEGRKPGESWHTVQASPLGVDDATVLFVLEALQVLRVRDTGANGAETRRLSFRELGVEQIGNVYESLLDHTAKRAADAVVSLKGPKGEEPEIELRELEQCYDASDPSKLVSFVKEKTGRSEPSIKKDLEYEIEDDSARWLVACGNDHDLYGRVKPVAGLVREDRRQQPAVYPKDSVYVTAGADRRSTGTHYTPPSLTEPVVRYALEPLVYVGPAEGLPEAEWKLRTPVEILALRVCDLACGSGAFLVQACRYLAERLVEAWELLETANPGRLLVTPEGGLSTGAQGERIIPKDDAERQAIARRVVADRCLYGVDINPSAIEMAKLSLWLVTLQRDKPFGFLDHSMRCGDALLGVVHSWQLERLSLADSGAQLLLASGAVRRTLAVARSLREQLEVLPTESTRDVEHKAQLLTTAERATHDLHIAADGLVAWHLNSASKDKSSHQPSDTIQDLASDLLTLLEDSGAASESALRRATLTQQNVASFARNVPIDSGYSGPFHWLLEFPEVFDHESRPKGFDCVVGNPPFLGSMRIAEAIGDSVLASIKNRWRHRRGNADLVVYFLLRASELLHRRGAMGLVLSKAIAEGKGREIGLEWLLSRGWTICWSRTAIPWPGAAGVVVSPCVLISGVHKGTPLLNDTPVSAITSFLDSRANSRTPHVLPSNKGLVSQGTVLLGDGFTVSFDTAHAWMRSNPRYSQILRPYVNGMDVNTSPGHEPSSWVICADDLSEDQFAEFPEAIERVRRLVRPQRDVLHRQIHEACYWKHWDKRAAAYAELRQSSEQAIVIPVVSKYLNVAVVPSSWILSNKLIFLRRFDWHLFGVLCSGIHSAWALNYISHLGSTLSYSITACFSTFPCPPGSDDVRAAASEFESARLGSMRVRRCGLTSLYNKFHDPACNDEDVGVLRSLMAEMDRATLAAYEWSDLQPEHGFHTLVEGVRFSMQDSLRAEILDRLLALNHTRHAAEVEE